MNVDLVLGGWVVGVVIHSANQLVLINLSNLNGFSVSIVWIGLIYQIYCFMVYAMLLSLYRRYKTTRYLFLDFIGDVGVVCFQVTTLPDEFPDAHSVINDLRLEYVIAVEGVVRSRPSESLNKKMKTGMIEVSVLLFRKHSQCQDPWTQVYVIVHVCIKTIIAFRCLWIMYSNQLCW